ncbi:hypothetical protein [Methylomonas rosea]|uniref:Uncharacterized protein n=1 Tax=Methylomonas rosea TaxID=2952227 RepID=A0ABT1TVP5_9GAMM|nr:hypothetical protein [Methylomonas sp. WSC-7]MCQ8118839.1 hypothetical protein [Methylomonas sp. WSC-7]
MLKITSQSQCEGFGLENLVGDVFPKNGIPKIEISISCAQASLSDFGWFSIQVPVRQFDDRISHQLAVFG